MRYLCDEELHFSGFCKEVVVVVVLVSLESGRRNGGWIHPFVRSKICFMLEIYIYIQIYNVV